MAGVVSGYSVRGVGYDLSWVAERRDYVWRGDFGVDLNDFEFIGESSGGGVKCVYDPSLGDWLDIITVGIFFSNEVVEFDKSGWIVYNGADQINGYDPDGRVDGFEVGYYKLLDGWSYSGDFPVRGGYYDIGYIVPKKKFGTWGTVWFRVDSGDVIGGFELVFKRVDGESGTGLNVSYWSVPVLGDNFVVPYPDDWRDLSTYTNKGRRLVVFIRDDYGDDYKRWLI